MNKSFLWNLKNSESNLLGSEINIFTMNRCNNFGMESYKYEKWKLNVPFEIETFNFLKWSRNKQRNRPCADRVT